MGPLEWVHHGHFRAMLFRRTSVELERSLVDRSRFYYPKLGARYNGTKGFWTFPSGARIYFSHLQHESDAHSHQSAEYQYIGFDELTTFSEGQYRYLLSRARSSRGLPIRIRSGTNPDINWVRRRWAPWVDGSAEYDGPRAAPGEVLWYVTRADGTDEYVPEGTPEALSRCFIPAKVGDNPSINDEYTRQLRTMDPVQRARLLDGDWMAEPAAGRYFQRHWCQFCDPSDVPENATRIRYWDRAGTNIQEWRRTKSGKEPDWTAGVRMARSGSTYYVEDVYRFRGSPGEVDDAIRSCAETDGKRCWVGVEQEPGQSGKDQAQRTVRELAGWRVRVQRPSVDKVTRFSPVSSQAEHGNVVLVRGPWLEPYCQELERFPEGEHDDQVDGTSGAFAELVSAVQTKVIPRSRYERHLYRGSV